MSNFHFFTDFDLLDVQPVDDSFGEIYHDIYSTQTYSSEHAYQLTDVHQAKYGCTYINNDLAQPRQVVNNPHAYAICDGTIIICPVLNSNILNIILKPTVIAQTGLPQVKYFIYRGILAESLFSFDDTSNRYNVLNGANGESQQGNLIGQLRAFIHPTNPTLNRAAQDGGLNYLYNLGSANPPAELVNSQLDDLFLNVNVRSINISKGYILGDFVTVENQQRRPYPSTIPLHNVASIYHEDQGKFGLEIIMDNDNMHTRVEDVRRTLSSQSQANPPVNLSNFHNRTIVFERFDKNNLPLFTITSNNSIVKDVYKICRNKERILNYLDPAAFWGSFINYQVNDINFQLDAVGKFSKPTLAAISPNLRAANPPGQPISVDANDPFYGVYDNLNNSQIFEYLLKGTDKESSAPFTRNTRDLTTFSYNANFFRMSTVYIDIRNNNNDSFNYNLDKFFEGLIKLNTSYNSNPNGDSLLVKGLRTQASSNVYQYWKCSYDSLQNPNDKFSGWPILKFMLQTANGGSLLPSYPFKIWQNDSGNLNVAPTMFQNGSNALTNDSYFNIELRLFNGYEDSEKGSIVYPNCPSQDIKVKKIYKSLIPVIPATNPPTYAENDLRINNVQNSILDLDRNFFELNTDENHNTQSETLQFKIYCKNYVKTVNNIDVTKHFPISTYFKLTHILNHTILDLRTIDTDITGVAISPESGTSNIVIQKNVDSQFGENISIEIVPHEYMDCIFQPLEITVPNPTIVGFRGIANPLLIRNYKCSRYFDNHRFMGNDFLGDVGVSSDSAGNCYFYAKAVNLRDSLNSQGTLVENTPASSILNRPLVGDRTFLAYLVSQQVAPSVISLNNNPNSAITPILYSGTTIIPYENFVFLKLTNAELNAINTILTNSINNNILDSHFKIYLGFKINSFLPAGVQAEARTGTIYDIYLRGNRTQFDSVSNKFNIFEINVPTGVQTQNFCTDVYKILGGLRFPSIKQLYNTPNNYGYSIENPESNLLKLESKAFGVRGMNLNKLEFMNFMYYVNRNIEKVWSNTNLTKSNVIEQYGNRGLYGALNSIAYKPNVTDASWEISSNPNDSGRILSPELKTVLNIRKSTPNVMALVEHEEIVISVGSIGRSEIVNDNRRSGRFDISDMNTEFQNTAAHEYGHILGLIDRYGYAAQAENQETSPNLNKIRKDDSIGTGFTMPILDLDAMSLNPPLTGSIITNNYPLAESGYFKDYKWAHNLMSSQNHIPSRAGLVNVFYESQYIDRFWNDFPVNTGYFKNLDQTAANQDILTIFILPEQIEVILGHMTEQGMVSSQGVYLYSWSDKLLRNSPDPNTSPTPIHSKGSFCGVIDMLNGNIISISDFGYLASSALSRLDLFNVNTYTPSNPPTTSNPLQSPSDNYVVVGIDDSDANVRIANIISNARHNPLLGRILSNPNNTPFFDQRRMREVISGGSRWIYPAGVTIPSSVNFTGLGDVFINLPLGGPGSTELFRMDAFGANVWVYPTQTFDRFGSNLPDFFARFDPSKLGPLLPWRIDELQNSVFLDALNNRCNYFQNRYAISFLQTFATL